MKHLLITFSLIALCGCTAMTDLLVEQPADKCPGDKVTLRKFDFS